VDPALFVLAAYAAGIVVGPVLAWRQRSSTEAARLRRALARARPTHIADASGSVAKITGRVGAISTTEAPLSGRPCVHWSVTVLRYELVLLHVERTVDFLVRDDTGKAIVSAAGARVLATPKAGTLRARFDRTEPRAAKLLQVARGALSTLFDPSRPMTFVEHVITDGDEISVSGAAQWAFDPEPDPAAAGGYREPPKRLEIAGRDGVAVMIGRRDASAR
jgi:hypothetical protein